jgi:hypothetical protein
LVLSLSCSSEQLLFVILLSFAAFRAFLLAFAVFLLLDDLLELFSAFWSSSCASWGLGFELQTLCFCCQWTHKGEIEKPSGQWLGLMRDESLTWRGLNSNPG